MAEPKLLPCPVDLLEELADQLEIHVAGLYHDIDHGTCHPAMRHRYDRDMEPVRRARRLLNEHTRAEARDSGEG